MRVKDLIAVLQTINDDELPVGYMVHGEFKTLDDTIGVNVYADCVELQHEVVVPK